MHEKLKEGEEKERMREAKENKLQENCIPREEELRERGKSTGRSEEKMLSRGYKEKKKRESTRLLFFLLFCKLSLFLCF